MTLPEKIKGRSLSLEARDYLNNQENYIDPHFTAESLYVWNEIVSRLEERIKKNKEFFHYEYLKGYELLNLSCNPPQPLVRSILFLLHLIGKLFL